MDPAEGHLSREHRRAGCCRGRGESGGDTGDGEGDLDELCAGGGSSGRNDVDWEDGEHAGGDTGLLAWAEKYGLRVRWVRGLDGLPLKGVVQHCGFLGFTFAMRYH